MTDKVVIDSEAWPYKSADDFINFAKKLGLSPEQMKSGKLEEVKGLKLDHATGNVVAPPELLREQGELLYKLFTKYNSSDTYTAKLNEVFGEKTLEKLLSDAAFKVEDKDKQDIMHLLTFRSPYNTDKVLNHERLLPLVKAATLEQLELTDKNGETALSYMTQYFPHKKDGNDSERKNYAIIEEIKNIIDDKRREKKAHANGTASRSILPTTLTGRANRELLGIGHSR